MLSLTAAVAMPITEASEIHRSVSSNEGVAAAPNGKPAKVYTCCDCGKGFRRREHCSRHEQGHRNERPFVCRFCSRRFARKDVIRRHLKSFHPLESEKSKLQKGAEANHTYVSGVQIDHDGSHHPAMEKDAQCEGSEKYGGSLIDPPYPESTGGGSPVASMPSTVNLGFSNLPNEAAPDQNVSPPGGVNLGIPSGHSRATVESVDNTSQVRQPSFSTHETVDTDMEEFLRTLESSDLEPALNSAINSNDANFPDSTSEIDVDGGDFNFFSMLSNSIGDFEDPSFNLDVELPTTSVADKNFENRWESHGSAASQTRNPAEPASTIRTGLDYQDQSRVTGPVSATSARIPCLSNHLPKTMPPIVVDQAAYDVILQDVQRRLSAKQVLLFKMPNAKNMGLFLTTYLRSFHRHFPLVHLPHLVLTETPSHYLLSMCAIGALYHLDRQTAKHLWYWASVMVEGEPISKSDMTPTSIGYLQCKVLLTIFALFSGDLNEEAMSKLGYWTMEYRQRRTALLASKDGRGKLNWEEWSTREASKRIVLTIYIMSSLMTITYGMPPICSVTQDIEIEMPEHENLWEAATAEQWQELMYQNADVPSLTVRSAMRQLFFGNKVTGGQIHQAKWSAFATSVVMHAVNIHMWNVTQCTQSFDAFAVDGNSSTQLRQPMIAQIEAGLGRCNTLLTKNCSDRDISSDDAEGPLIFNCLASLRCAYVRVFTGAGSFDRLILLSSDQNHVNDAIRSLVNDTQQRSSFMTKAVRKAYEGFLVPIKVGYLLVRKTAALSWSVEHAVSGWDCALFVVKWIHALEMEQLERPPDNDERQTLQNFRELVNEVDEDNCKTGSLAAHVARTWACFLDDTWVWSVTPRMGNVLRKIATVYSEEWDLAFPEENSRGLLF